MEDMKPRLKLNTFLTKKHIMETKIIPYFEKKSLAEITATDVIQWQNQLLSMRDENGMPICTDLSSHHSEPAKCDF